MAEMLQQTVECCWLEYQKKRCGLQAQQHVAVLWQVQAEGGHGLITCIGDSKVSSTMLRISSSWSVLLQPHSSLQGVKLVYILRSAAAAGAPAAAAAPDPACPAAATVLQAPVMVVW
jgi:hypothetical protein